MRSQHRFKSSLIWSHCPLTQILCTKLVSSAPLAATSPLPRPSSSRVVARNPAVREVSTSSWSQSIYPSVASAPPSDATSGGIVVVFPLINPWSHSPPPLIPYLNTHPPHRPHEYVSSLQNIITRVHSGAASRCDILTPPLPFLRWGFIKN